MIRLLNWIIHSLFIIQIDLNVIKDSKTIAKHCRMSRTLSN